ncbi:MAG: C69 family dipeptidase [Acetilactobacillus jinshanensis]
METAGGHHWVAKRIPDDCYAVVPNQISIQDINFNSSLKLIY